MPYAVQWMKPPLASGSSTTSTSSTACPDGASRHVIVGGLPAPSQVSSFGIAPPSLICGEASFISRPAVGSLDLLDCSPPPPQPATATSAAATSARPAPTAAQPGRRCPPGPQAWGPKGCRAGTTRRPAPPYSPNRPR